MKTCDFELIEMEKDWMMTQCLTDFVTMIASAEGLDLECLVALKIYGGKEARNQYTRLLFAEGFCISILIFNRMKFSCEQQHLYKFRAKVSARGKLSGSKSTYNRLIFTSSQLNYFVT